MKEIIDMMDKVLTLNYLVLRFKSFEAKEQIRYVRASSGTVFSHNDNSRRST